MIKILILITTSNTIITVQNYKNCNQDNNDDDNDSNDNYDNYNIVIKTQTKITVRNTVITLLFISIKINKINYEKKNNNRHLQA